MFVVSPEVINPLDLYAAVLRDTDGAVTTFTGVVRNHSQGRMGVLSLTYEAYLPMALRVLEDLGQEACARFGIRDVAIAHRIGSVAVGEISVCIAVSASHREATFDACRWLIDQVKADVPIWKREIFADSESWSIPSVHVSASLTR